MVDSPRGWLPINTGRAKKWCRGLRASALTWQTPAPNMSAHVRHRFADWSDLFAPSHPGKAWRREKGCRFPLSYEFCLRGTGQAHQSVCRGGGRKRVAYAELERWLGAGASLERGSEVCVYEHVSRDDRYSRQHLEGERGRVGTGEGGFDAPPVGQYLLSLIADGERMGIYEFSLADR
jgi:hypothetical protein